MDVPEQLFITHARNLGREAFFAGRRPEDCPYAVRSVDWEAWIGAYEAARDFRAWLDGHLAREG